MSKTPYKGPYSHPGDALGGENAAGLRPAAAVTAMDHISDLPDEILRDILLLPRSPDAAARTTVLSRRWIRTWAGLISPELVLEGGYRQPHGEFMDSIDAALAAFSAPTIGRVQFAIPRSDATEVPVLRVTSWLRFASQRLVGTLSLHCPRLSNLILKVTLAAASNVSIHSDSLFSLTYNVARTCRIKIVAPKLEKLSLLFIDEALISAPKLADVNVHGGSRRYHFVDETGHRLHLLEVKRISASLMQQFDKVEELKLCFSILQGKEEYESFVYDTTEFPILLEDVEIDFVEGSHEEVELFVKQLSRCQEDSGDARRSAAAERGPVQGGSEGPAPARVFNACTSARVLRAREPIPLPLSVSVATGRSSTFGKHGSEEGTAGEPQGPPLSLIASSIWVGWAGLPAWGQLGSGAATCALASCSYKAVLLGQTSSIHQGERRQPCPDDVFVSSRMPRGDGSSYVELEEDEEGWHLVKPRGMHQRSVKQLGEVPQPQAERRARY
ncbi:hypothetical protein PR202_ga29626 [Eleusine coracana subsp. coracana]|uniref:F-box domain-containing protein n=1 Tax=Eleusine coracana subsp. coracana TaxID=191504 RepID=A0AAV5DLM3_ELECO|nr:hypothetical protein PR202_ga29626 [Eleusine coracana subsp. coracana]